MARDENPPVERGATYFAGRTPDSDSAAWLEGKRWIWEDQQFGTGLEVHTRLVRNSSGVTLQGRRVVFYDPAYIGQRVGGYVATTAAAAAGVLDDYLPASGCPSNDLAWIVTKGPVLVKTSLAGNAEDVIAQGDNLFALTGATTGAVTSGRVQTLGLSNATFNQGLLGLAMSAATTAQTDASIAALVAFRF